VTTDSGTATRTTTARPWWVALLALAAAVAALVGIAFSGAALRPVLGDPGGVVRWGLPVSTTLTELAGSVTLGALLLAVGVLPRRDPDERRRPRAAGPLGVAAGAAYPRALLVAAFAAGTWTLVSLVHLVLEYASVAGVRLGGASFGNQLGLFVTQIPIGRTWLFVTVAAALVTGLALVVSTPTGAAWAVLPVLAALWQQAQLGHAAGAAGHSLAVSSMVVHLVSAAVWIGGLAALVLVVRRLGSDIAAAVSRYSVIAGWCYVGIATSGIVNAVVRMDSWSDLTTKYGALLLTKVALFGVLGLIGFAHRRSVVPRLASDPERRGAFWRLVAFELVVMGAVSGVAVALGSTAPPVPQIPPPDPTPAYRLTGHPLPPPLDPSRWFTEWDWDVVLAFAAAAAVVVYLRWVWRLRRRGDHWSVARTLSWVFGMALFVWATSAGPNRYGHVLFSAHMVQHMVLAAVVPIFLALAGPVSLALRALPARATRMSGDASRGPREWILVLVHSRVGQFFAHPVVAAANFVVSMLVFYYSGLFEWSLRTGIGHYAMVVHFTLVGYLFVNGIVGVDPGPKRLPYPQRLILLFATMAFHAFFGVTLVGGDSLLVASWYGLMGRPWGPSAIADQQAGGAITWGIGELPTLALAIGVVYAWSQDDERAARRRDRQVAREGDIELDEYNAMLARLADRDAHDAHRAPGDR
jgi:cytochrome c oxidase assembly factor CtaG/putative copper export protein